MNNINRRHYLKQMLLISGSFPLALKGWCLSENETLNGIQSFIHQTAKDDGSFRPGINPEYKGMSDTEFSSIAATVYANIICKTFGWDLPYPKRTLYFIYNKQKPDGVFYDSSDSANEYTPQLKFYNTVQSVVTLKLMNTKPKYDPTPIAEYFLDETEMRKLPLYMTSFFPLFYTAIGVHMPQKMDLLIRTIIADRQSEDGYIANHVASTFHAAHYYRLIGLPTPKADLMVERVLNDQKDDGSWSLHQPSWDVHAVFDALFILRQLGDANDPRIQNAYKKANDWILKCRKQDGGFTHFPENSVSDMDAVYFHAGALVQTGFLSMQQNIKNEEILGWGHAMIPGKHYSCIENDNY